MTFRPDKVDEFLDIFDRSAPHIRGVPGCRHLELWQDTTSPNVFTTLSQWESDHALQRYRKSELFRKTWARTKMLFAAPPSAFSHVAVRLDRNKSSA